MNTGTRISNAPKSTAEGLQMFNRDIRKETPIKQALAAIANVGEPVRHERRRLDRMAEKYKMTGSKALQLWRKHIKEKNNNGADERAIDLGEVAVVDGSNAGTQTE